MLYRSPTSCIEPRLPHQQDSGTSPETRNFSSSQIPDSQVNHETNDSCYNGTVGVTHVRVSSGIGTATGEMPTDFSSVGLTRSGPKTKKSWKTELKNSIRMAPKPVVVASVWMASQSVGEASVRMTYLQKRSKWIRNGDARRVRIGGAVVECSPVKGHSKETSGYRRLTPWFRSRVRRGHYNSDQRNPNHNNRGTVARFLSAG